MGKRATVRQFSLYCCLVAIVMVLLLHLIAMSHKTGCIKGR